MASVSIYEEILGVSANDSEQVIKKAFRTKAKKLHPDVNTSVDAHEKFILLQEAYDCLIKLNKGHPYSNDQGINFDDWIRYHQQGARQQAREKASMRYAEYLNSDEFKSIAAVETIFEVIGITIILLAGTLIPIFILYKTEGMLFYLLSVIFALIIPKKLLELIRSLPQRKKLFDSVRIIIKRKSFHFLALMVLNFAALSFFTLKTLLPFKIILLSYLIPIVTTLLSLKLIKNSTLNSIKKLLIWSGWVPLVINLFYCINYIGSHDTQIQSYPFSIVQESDHHGINRNTTTIVLPKNLYDEYHHIRFFLDSSQLYSTNTITLTIAKGLMGIQVLRHYHFSYESTQMSTKLLRQITSYYL